VTPDQIEQQLSEKMPNVRNAIEAVRSLIANSHPWLTPTYKWNCVMWTANDRLVVGVAPLANGIKVCFFEDPNLSRDFALQRWGSAHTSHNITFRPAESVNLDEIEQLIASLQSTE
jgi:uncharacterized protein YdhG (YjbR/CyaY superfamily)